MRSGFAFPLKVHKQNKKEQGEADNCKEHEINPEHGKCGWEAEAPNTHATTDSGLINSTGFRGCSLTRCQTLGMYKNK